MSVRESSERAVSLLSLSLGVLVGPIVALVNQQAIYASDTWACGHNEHAALHVIPALCLIAVAGAGATSLLNWRAVNGGTEDERGGMAARTRFLALLGMGISAISATVIAAQWFSVAMFTACMRA